MGHFRRVLHGRKTEEHFRRPQPTPPSAHQQQLQQSLSSSTEAPYETQGSEMALGLMQSCGLEPTDLAHLAELPEEMLNLDSLPHILRQLKERRETTHTPPSSATATTPLSSRRPAPSRTSDAPSASCAVNEKWSQSRNQPVQYPLDHILTAAKSRSFEQLSSDRPDHRDHPRASSAAGSYKHPSSTETPLPPPLQPSPSCYIVDYGHQGRTTDQGNYGSGLPREPHRARAAPWLDPPLPNSRAGAGQASAAPTKSPSWKEALDFRGSAPGVFPHSCSLCDVTAVSDKVWLRHINGSLHADKQLALLQRYPSWDCRMGRKSSGGGNSKVVCAKFEAQCVDEACLRTLTEPFGKIAFVEMGSSDQAKDLEKYYGSNPATSSRVLSFTPAPQGEDGFSDLMTIAFIEMKIEADAQKLVNYYSTNSLKINGNVIKVSFSGEYNTLMRVSSAKKYVEQVEGEGAGPGGPSVTKRSRSPSPRKGRRQGDEGHSKRSRKEGVVEEEGEEEEQFSVPGEQAVQWAAAPLLRPQCEEEAVLDAATPPAQPGSKAEVAVAAGTDPEADAAGSTQDAEELSDDDSDIEGMAVIGEDGESLGDEEDEEECAVKDVKVKEEPIEEEQISGPEVCSLSDPEELKQEEELNDEDDKAEEKNEKEEEQKQEKECDDKDEQEEGDSKVIYFRNLPSGRYTDTEFVNLVKAHGKAEQYILVPDRQEGFIQMSSRLEAMLASRELGNEPGFKGSVLDVALTHKYPSLSAGWTMLSEEREEDPGRSSSRSSSPSRASEKEALDKSTTDPAESIPQPTGTEESSRISPEEESALSRKCPSEEPEVEVPHEEEKETPLEEVAPKPESKDEEKADEESGDKSTSDGPTQQSDQNTEGGCLEDEETKQPAGGWQPQPGPAGGSVEPPKPTKPIGAEFVRPVVGYFCNLCKVIYVDEDEAKTQHCSSLTHYQKYKEHTGQDPWSS
ncbi:LOW QUALITY PROTEIN: hypothetical protein CRUP_022111 [Coryphaenoides rupestris]|nr:LOW QUALITY PROTEIN: hypothetical protein CRUP_022111 [Coryphaenoides rupestris]